jgi:hypothetical protein
MEWIVNRVVWRCRALSKEGIMEETRFDRSLQAIADLSGRRDALRSLGAAGMGLLATLGLASGSGEAKGQQSKRRNDAHHKKNKVKARKQHRHTEQAQDRPDETLDAPSGVAEERGLVDDILKKLGPTGPTGPRAPRRPSPCRRKSSAQHVYCPPPNIFLSSRPGDRSADVIRSIAAAADWRVHRGRPRSRRGR